MNLDKNSIKVTTKNCSKINQT